MKYYFSWYVLQFYLKLVKVSGALWWPGDRTAQHLMVRAIIGMAQHLMAITGMAQHLMVRAITGTAQHLMVWWWNNR